MKEAIKTEKREHKSVKDWPSSEQPYERLRSYGAKPLSDTELLAIILRTGSGSHGVFEVAQALITKGTHWLRDASMAELATVPGIGAVRAAQLIAMIEFGRRVNAPVRVTNRPQVRDPQTAKVILSDMIANLDREEMHALLLDTRGRLISTVELSVGGLRSATVTPRDLFREAVKANASTIILGHNHPSGDVTPSQADIASTKKLMELGRLFGIPINDHIIVATGGSLSLKEMAYI